MSDAKDTQKWRKEMARDEHEKTYTLFLDITKWGSIAIAVILLLMLILVY